MASPNSFAAVRRVPTPMLIVGGLHLAVIWAFLNGLQIHSSPTPPVTVAEVIDHAVPPPEKPLAATEEPRELKFTLPDIPVVIPQPTDPQLTVKGDDTAVTVPPVTGFALREVEPQPVIEGATVDPRHPLTRPDYPMSGRRDSQQGAVALEILVGTDGRVRDAKVSQSSGFELLDQAAMTEAKQHWRLRPARRNGVAFEQWLTLRVVFRLEDR
jgi:periplasmic protein TonB